MDAADPWVMLRTGKIEEGLSVFKQAHSESPSASHTMELGVAYLWVERYEIAWKHFSAMNEAYPRYGSGFYGMAGAAKWCLGEYIEAVKQWIVGLDSNYADTAGLGLRLPLLLFFASVVKPETYCKTLAEELLKEKSKDRRITRWPGPIVRWLSDQIGEIELHAHCKVDDESDSRDRQWLAEFYQSTVHYDKGKHSEFVETMRKLTDTSRSEWKDETFFLARMWSEEFFLARHAADLT